MGGDNYLRLKISTELLPCMEVRLVSSLVDE